MYQKILATLLPALLFGVTAAAADKKPLDEKSAKQKLLKAGAFQAEVVSVNKTSQSFKVKVDYQYRKINVSAYRAIQKAQLDLQYAQARGDRNRLLSAQRSLLQNQAKLYTIEKGTQEYQIAAVSGVEVRLKNPKPQFTKEGEAKELTASEKRKLRGRDKLYPGEWADIKEGEFVVVYLVRERRRSTPANAEGEVQTRKTNKVVVLNDPDAEPARDIKKKD